MFQKIGVILVITVVIGSIFVLFFTEQDDSSLEKDQELQLTDKDSSPRRNRGHSPAEPSKEGVIEGIKVVDRDNRPVAGALVVLVKQEERKWRLVCNEKGFVELPPELHDRTCTLRIYAGHRDHGAVTELMDPPARTRTTVIRLKTAARARVQVLRHDGDPGRNFIVTATAGDGKPFPTTPMICDLSQVELNPHDLPLMTRWPRSDEAGRVDLCGLPPGPCRISVHGDGRLMAQVTPTLQAGVNNVVIRLPEEYDVVPFIQDQDGAPIEGARAWLFAKRDNKLVRVARAVSGTDGLVHFRDLIAQSTHWELWAEKNDHWARSTADAADLLPPVTIHLHEEPSVVRALSPSGAQLPIRSLRISVEAVDDFDYNLTFPEPGRKDVRLPFVFRDMSYSLNITVDARSARGLFRRWTNVFDGREMIHEVVLPKKPKSLGRGGIRLIFDSDLKNETVTVSIQGFRCSLNRTLALKNHELLFERVFNGRKSVVVTHPERGVFVGTCDVEPDRNGTVEVHFENESATAFKLPDSGIQVSGREFPWTWYLLVEPGVDGGSVVVARGDGGNGETVKVMTPQGRQRCLVFVEAARPGRFRTMALDSKGSISSSSRRRLSITMDPAVRRTASVVSVSHIGGALAQLESPVGEGSLVFDSMPPGTFEVIAIMGNGQVVTEEKVTIPWDLEWHGDCHLKRR